MVVVGSVNALAILVSLAMTGSLEAVPQPCERSWSESFSLVSLNGPVHALAVYDDGAGSTLYAGGEFYNDSMTAGGLARWRGNRWEYVVPEGYYQVVRALTVWNDGNGPALYAQRQFGEPGQELRTLGRYDGKAWTLLSSEDTDGTVYALCPFDDGSGSALYVGGEFERIGGAAARSLARWNGSVWSPVPGGLSRFGGTGRVRALQVRTEQGREVLYVAGNFDRAGDVVARGIARWDGTVWSEVGGGVSGLSATCTSLAEYDDGTGPALYVGGGFTKAGEADANSIVRWDGSAWGYAGEFHGTPDAGALVETLAVLDLGDGPALFAGGSFTKDGQKAVSGIARWDGGTWLSVGDSGSGGAFTHAMAVVEDGEGRSLYAGGPYDQRMHGAPSKYIARFNGSEWFRVGEGVDKQVDALAAFDPGDGARLYAAGAFGGVGTIAADGLASWDWSNGWTPVGGGPANPPPGQELHVWSLAASAVDGESAIYAAGNFGRIGDVETPHGLARWDGQAWSLPPGLDPPSFIWDLYAAHGPNGDELYAQGQFGGESNRLAGWTGSGWELLPGVPGAGGIQDLAIFDDGAGAALYVCGSNILFDGKVNSVGKLVGEEWVSIGDGLLAESVTRLKVYDDGNGPLLFAGGFFRREQEGSPFDMVAAWDGTEWHDVGGGISGPGGALMAMAVADDGRGLALYAGGLFTQAGGKTARQIARWDGASWTAMDDGIVGPGLRYVRTIAGLPDPERPSIFAGGDFLIAGGHSSGNIAQWLGCQPCAADCTDDGVVDLADFVCFQSRFVADDEEADCDSSGVLDLFDFLCFVNAFNQGC